MRKYTSFLFKCALLLFGVALATTSFMSGPQQEAPTLDGNRTEDIRRLPGKETVADFRGVAKKAIPAVVSIKVQSHKKPQIFGDDTEEDPLDLFGGNDLWQFFGLPKRDLRSQPFV